MKYIILIVLLLSMALNIVLVAHELSYPIYEEPITAEQGIKYIEMARKSHQYFVDEPEKLKEFMGTVQFHQDWVERYNQVIELIRRTK